MVKPSTVRQLRRKAPSREPADRILIVCEGKKTETRYFEAIRQSLRVPGADVVVLHSDRGTDPQQIVEFAEAQFRQTRDYQQVHAVFDRDEHRGYANAIAMSTKWAATLRDHNRQSVKFRAIPSVPCFEVWYLLRFVSVEGPLHRGEAVSRLKSHLPGYEKGASNIYERTRAHLEAACERTQGLRQRYAALPGDDVYTDVDVLVMALLLLRDPPQRA